LASRAVRVTFQEELDQLEAGIHELGTLVLRAVGGALNALVQQDTELADEVIAFDDEVDQRYVDIEHGIQTLLARQTPVAGDLRLVLAMLHVNLHLERIADYCVTVAKLVKLAPSVAPDRLFVDAFQEMGERAEEMIKVALDAFANRNAEQAATLVDLDELIDRANRRFVQHVLSFGRDPTLREWGLRMMLVSRCFERIGDHAVDIGERVAYLVTGEFREFTDASHPSEPEG
jgi:phosphate transport system protein